MIQNNANSLDIVIHERVKILKSIKPENGKYYSYNPITGELLDFDNTYQMLNSYTLFCDLCDLNEWNAYINRKHNRKKKRQRCYNKFKKINSIAKDIGCKIVFGTLTYSDDFLSLSEENKTKKIQRYLKKYFAMLQKNKDYCPTTGREHIHYVGITQCALIDTGKKSKQGRKLYKLANDTEPIGFNSVEIIPYDYDDTKILSNYLVKLNNHSNKDSVKKTRLSIIKNNKLLQQYNDKAFIDKLTDLFENNIFIEEGQ